MEIARIRQEIQADYDMCDAVDQERITRLPRKSFDAQDLEDTLIETGANTREIIELSDQELRDLFLQKFYGKYATPECKSVHIWHGWPESSNKRQLALGELAKQVCEDIDIRNAAIQDLFDGKIISALEKTGLTYGIAFMSKPVVDDKIVTQLINENKIAGAMVYLISKGRAPLAYLGERGLTSQDILEKIWKVTTTNSSADYNFTVQDSNGTIDKSNTGGE